MTTLDRLFKEKNELKITTENERMDFFFSFDSYYDDSLPKTNDRHCVELITEDGTRIVLSIWNLYKNDSNSEKQYGFQGQVMEIFWADGFTVLKKQYTFIYGFYDFKEKRGFVRDTLKERLERERQKLLLIG